MTEIRRVRMPPPATKCEPWCSGGLRGELQAPGGDHAQLGDFCDYPSESPMPQAVFKAGQKRRLPLRLHIDHPVGIKSGLSKSGSEEIRPGQTPDDVSCTARHDAGDEESRRCCMQRSRSPSGDLVKSAERQPALWKAPIDFGNAKRQDAGCALSDRPNPGDPGAQVIESGARK